MAEEEKRFKSHLETCTVCQKELLIEAAIDKELLYEYPAEGIETTVLGELRLRQIAERTEGWRVRQKYLVYAMMLAVFGFMILPWVMTLSNSQASSFLSTDQIMQFASFITANIYLIAIASFAVMVFSTIFSVSLSRR